MALFPDNSTAAAAACCGKSCNMLVMFDVPQLLARGGVSHRMRVQGTTQVCQQVTRVSRIVLQCSDTTTNP